MYAWLTTFNFKVIAVAVDRDEIEQHWSWIEKNLMPTVGTFDLEEDVRHFVLTKIAGLVANDEHFAQPGSSDSISDVAVLHNYHQLFVLPSQERLVNYYSCTYWKGKTPWQGKLYLSVNFLCFYSFMVGTQTRIKVRWTDVTKLDKNTSFLLPQGITVVTRDASYSFSMFSNFEEVYTLIVQLSNLAMKQLVEEEGFSEDLALRRKCLQEGTRKRAKKNSTSFVKRDLDARHRSEMYR
ncbi:Protein TBC-9 c [Aphelenchoides avenae]|nr:Protein TBC-9 c [Aphelenchus avenae]